MVDADAPPPEPPVPPVPPDAAALCSGGSYWSVSGRRWDDECPALPPEYAALLAPPIVVGAAAVSPGRVTRPTESSARGQRGALRVVPEPARPSASVEMLIYGLDAPSDGPLVVPAAPRRRRGAKTPGPVAWEAPEPAASENGRAPQPGVSHPRYGGRHRRRS